MTSRPTLSFKVGLFIGGIQMILFNFDFLKSELTKNTIQYLQDEYKEELEMKASQWDFNGIGFKNKTALVNYICEKKFLPKNYFSVKKISSSSYRINEGTIELLYELFKKEAPLFIDRERLYKIMLISSNLMFTPNSKISFTIMFEEPDKKWSANEIIEQVKHHDFKVNLKEEKIEESLERYTKSNEISGALVTCEMVDGVKKYKINFTNFIYYIRHFDTDI